MSPTDLRRLQTERETYQDSYTIGKSSLHTGLAIVATQLAPADAPNSPRMGHIGQAKEIVDILREVQDWIPPFRAVFNPHDNPGLFTDWELKKQYLDAAKAKKCQLHLHSTFVFLITLCRYQYARSATCQTNGLAIGLFTNLASPSYFFRHRYPSFSTRRKDLHLRPPQGNGPLFAPKPPPSSRSIPRAQPRAHSTLRYGPPVQLQFYKFTSRYPPRYAHKLGRGHHEGERPKVRG